MKMIKILRCFSIIFVSVKKTNFPNFDGIKKLAKKMIAETFCTIRSFARFFFIKKVLISF